MLKDMLISLGDAISLKPDNVAERAQMVRYLNEGAKELYAETDLPGAIEEQRFAYDTTQGLISLPWFVDEVRGIRRASWGEVVKVIDSARKFQQDRFQQPQLTWEIARRSPLHTPISIEGLITVTIPVAQDIPFNVVIRGQTPQAAAISETLSFAPGDLTKTTTYQFAKEDVNECGIEAIIKDEITTADLVVKDAAAVEIAVIPNILNVANNIIIRARDELVTAEQTVNPYVDVRYKRVFIPLVNDTDVFCDSKLETALVYVARAFYAGLSKDETSMQQAILAQKKGDSLIGKVLSNQDIETEARIATGRVPTDRAWRRQWRRR